MIINIF